MPLSFVRVEVEVEVPAELPGLSLSVVVAEDEGVLEKVLARGPRCVSLSSVIELRHVSIMRSHLAMRSLSGIVYICTVAKLMFMSAGRVCKQV